jgi:AcrR family transcriptional regulator
MAPSERPLRKDAERNRQRILEAAKELFAERGLSVTLNDIAHHAGVGVGTVYRRFPDRRELIEALFEQRLEQIRELLEEALEDPNPWRGLTRFHERALELQAQDRGLAQLVLGAPGAPERLAKVRTQLQPLATELVERARAAGQLRADCQAEDFPIVQVMLSAVIDAAHDVAPELWRRYFAIVLQGLRAKPAPPEPLPTPSVSPMEIDEVLAGAWKQRRP